MYTEFADIYDLLMRDTPYEEWADFYEDIFKNEDIKPSLVLDLGCGTGTLTEILSERGYDMTGIDSSLAMLNQAIIKRRGNSLYLNQDMTDFELYGTMEAIISSLDCINYITSEKDLTRVFSLVYNYLDYDGIFIFDINTTYKLEKILGENTYTYDEDGIFYVWESFYKKDSRLCSFCLTFFLKEDDGTYSRIDEFQTERAWGISEITKHLEESGFCDIKVYGDKTFSSPKIDEERVFITARKRENK